MCSWAAPLPLPQLLAPRHGVPPLLFARLARAGQVPAKRGNATTRPCSDRHTLWPAPSHPPRRAHARV